jgi:hypothetical protein
VSAPVDEGDARPSVASALVTTLCVGLFAFQMRRHIESQIGLDHQAVAETYAGLVDEYLAGARSAAESVAKHTAVRAPLDLQAVNPELKGVSQETDVERRAAINAVVSTFPRFRNIGNIAADGTVYAMEPYAVQKQAPANLGDRDFFMKAARSGESSWSNVNTVPASGQPIVTIGVPVKDKDGKLQLVVNGTLLLDRLGETAKSVNVGDAATVMLFDTRGVPVVHPEPR